MPDIRMALKAALLFSSARVYLSIDAREFHFIDIQFKSVHQIGSCTLDRMENRKREKERESMRHLYNVQTQQRSQLP